MIIYFSFKPQRISMGLFAKLLRPTPLHQTYRSYLIAKTIEKQTKQERKYHPLRVNFYRQFLRPNDTVFDVGANVGNRVAAFLECGAKVIAVEPQPNCFLALSKKFGNSITIEKVGLGEIRGELEMKIATDSTVSSFNEEYINSTKNRFKYTTWVDKIKVEILTLDDLIVKYGIPQFCKIDVEGFELQVLKGLHSPIPYLSFEYCVPEIRNQLAECISRLNQINPSGMFNYSIGESMEWGSNSWMSFDQFMNHINTVKFIKTSFGDVYFKND